MVVIADGTRRLARQSVRTAGPWRARDLKGIAGPVRAWAALRASSVESRFEALHAAGAIDADRAGQKSSNCCCGAGRKPKAGDGQVCCFPASLVSGNPVSPPRFWSASAPSRMRDCAISARRSTPTARFIRSSARSSVPPDCRCTTRRERSSTSSTAMLAPASMSPRGCRLFAEMLSLPNDGRYPASGLTPQQRRQKTLEALVAHIAALSHSNPVLMIFEDAHWSDPTSLEVLRLAIERLVRHRVSADRDVPARVRAALVRATANGGAHHRATGATTNVGAMIDRVAGSMAAAREHPAGHPGTHRRHPAVRRRNDEGGARSSQRRRRTADCPGGVSSCRPGQSACFLDGAPRSAWFGQGGRTGRCDDRP